MEIKNRYSDYYLTLNIMIFFFFIVAVLTGVKLLGITILILTQLIFSIFFFRIPKRLNISDEQLTIYWPTRSSTISISEIEDIRVSKRFYDVVEIVTGSGSYYISPMHMDNMQTLLQWLENIFDSVKGNNSFSNSEDTKDNSIIFDYKLSFKFVSLMVLLFIFVTSMLFVINVSSEYILRLLIPFLILILSVSLLTKSKKIKIDDKNIEIITPLFKKSFSLNTISEIWIDNRGIVTFVSGNWLTMSVGSLGSLYYTGFYQYINKFVNKKKIHVRSMPVITHGMRLFTFISVLVVCGVILGILYASMVSLPFLITKHKNRGEISLNNYVVGDVTGENVRFMNGTSTVEISGDLLEKSKLSRKSKYTINIIKTPQRIIMYNSKKGMFKFGILFSFLYLIPLLIVSFFMIKLPFEKGESILYYYSFFDKIHLSHTYSNDILIDNTELMNS